MTSSLSWCRSSCIVRLMGNPKEVGDIAVAGVLASLLKKGYAILLPFGDSQRYDLVLDNDHRFVRIQCKSGRIRNGCIKFNTSSTEWYKGHRRKNYKGQIDYFGIYCAEIDKTYLVPVGSIGETQGSLRINPTKNKQARYVRWGTDYEV